MVVVVVVLFCIRVGYYMPRYTIRKKRNEACYTVFDTRLKKVKARCTTKAKAEKQVRMMHAFADPRFSMKLNGATRKRRR